MPKEDNKPKKVEVNPADYNDYGDYMAAKRVAESKVEEENAEG